MNFSDESEEKKTMGILGICSLSAGYLIVVENFIAIIILYRSSRLIFQVKLLAINLSIADFIAGLILALPDNYFSYWDCKMKKYFISTVVNVSMLSITVMNGDRVLVFRFAMRYYKYITERTVTILCVLTWPTTVLLSYLMFYDNSSISRLNCVNVYMIPNKAITMIATRTLLLLIMLSNILMLAYMMYYVRNKLRRVENTANVPNSLGSGDAKLIRKLWCLTGGFIVMTFPFFIVLNLSLLVSGKLPLRHVLPVCFIVCMLNSALNPVVYVWRFREPRYELQLLLCFFNPSFKEKVRQRRNQSLAEFGMQEYPQPNRTHEQEGNINAPT